MKFGWEINVLDAVGTPSPVELARMVEDAGFESIWMGGHTHVPADLGSSQRLGLDLDQTFWGQFDVFCALGAAAAATKKLTVGTGLCQLVQREPIATAKAVATVDHLAEGRFILGVGAGWNKEELQNHGVEYATRSERLREHVEAMRAIWGSEVAEYHGRFVDFTPLYQEPKPVQLPSPPVYLGGGSRKTRRFVAEFGDGWMPYYSPARAARDLGPFPGADWPEIESAMRDIRETAEAAGRDPAALSLSIVGVAPSPQVMESMVEAGVDRFIFDAHPFSGEDRVVKDIEEHIELVVGYGLG